MAAVSDELGSFTSKRIKLDIMETENTDNAQVESKANLEKQTTVHQTHNGVLSPKSTSDAQQRVGWSSVEGNDEEDCDDEDCDDEEEEDDDDASSTVSNVSDISGLSDMSGAQWKTLPSALVERAKLSGTDPSTFLSKITGADVSFTQDVPEAAIWKFIIAYLTEYPRRKRLPDVSCLDDVIRLLRTCNRIMVLTGAGVSVSCGIPDFRSRDGIYARLAQDFPDLPDPQAMFDMSYFRQNPKPFFKFANEIFPGKFTPSPAHRFIKALEKHNKLLRNYTQNIDTLEKQAGIQRVIECHGSFSTASCTKCKRQVKGDDIRQDIMLQRIPTCCDCGDEGIMKPDIVFFGEGLPEKFHDAMAADKDVADLLIVIGSSLKVRPVALVPHSLPSHVPQILINRERLPHLVFDVELLGDCDVILDHICYLLGETWEEVRWRPEPPLKDTTPQHNHNHDQDEDDDDDDDDDEEEEQDREIKCQRIGERQNGQGRGHRDVEGVRHTSLDSSRDSGIGESSNSSPSQPLLATSIITSPDPHSASTHQRQDDDDTSTTSSMSTSSPSHPQIDSDHPPKQEEEEESYYRLSKRRYVFPGAELYSHNS